MPLYKDVPQSLALVIESIECIIFDFDGVFTNNKVFLDEEGKESVVCDRSDGMGIGLLKKNGIRSIILSSEKNQVVSQRAKKLNIDCHQNVENKIDVLKSIAKKEGFNMKNIAFVGNDINDIDCLQEVGLSIVVKDSHPDVISAAMYITNSKGGNGAVREVCDLINNFQPCKIGLKESKLVKR